MMYPAQAERMGCKQHTEVQHSFLYGTTQPPPFSPFQYIRLRVLAYQISPSVKNQQDCSPALFRQIIRSLQNQMHRPFTGEMHFSVHPPILHGIVCHPRSDKRHCCYFRYIHNFRQFVFSIFIFTTVYTDSLLILYLAKPHGEKKTNPCESVYSAVNLYLLCRKRSALPAGTLPPACARLR